MELENTAIRLKRIMQERNLRQVDLLEMVKPFCEKYNVKINKSDISQYLSGKVKPGQEKLSMLGMALGVTESWLMGYDSPKEKSNCIEALTREETTLLDNYNKLNTKGKEKLLDYSDDLATNVKYLDNSNNEISATKEDDEFTKAKKKALKARRKAEQYFKEHPEQMPIASHDKEGDFTEEDYKHDDDLMMDDDLWND